MEVKKNLPRQIAVKVIINELLAGTYVQEDEQSPNYLLTLTQQKIYRFNLMAIIVSKQVTGSITNFLLDDRTGKITLRIFEDNKMVNALQIGDPVLIIGKVRMYNQEKYISSEIIKKVDSNWLKLRALETKNIPTLEIKLKASENIPITIQIPTNENDLEIFEEEIVEVSKTEISNELPAKKIITLIKELDLGEGVLIEELISKSMLNETEKIISKMLEKGDIFQNLPGRVKVL